MIFIMTILKKVGLFLLLIVINVVLTVIWCVVYTGTNYLIDGLTHSLSLLWVAGLCIFAGIIALDVLIYKRFFKGRLGKVPYVLNCCLVYLSITGLVLWIFSGFD